MFLGSIGYIMQGSGLQVLFELIYAKGNVNAMLNGKGKSKATLAHILIYTVLYGYLTAKLFKCNLRHPCNDNKFEIKSSSKTLKELEHSKILLHELWKRTLSPHCLINCWYFPILPRPKLLHFGNST